jgi:hypothetical protein
MAGKEQGAMSKFLVTYHGAGAPPNDPQLMAQAKAAFGAWVGEAGSALVDPGAPVRMVALVSNSGAGDGVEIGGYSIIEAPTIDDVRRILKSHPFVARGGTLQVNEVVAI